MNSLKGSETNFNNDLNKYWWDISIQIDKLMILMNFAIHFFGFVPISNDDYVKDMVNVFSCAASCLLLYIAHSVYRSDGVV